MLFHYITPQNMILSIVQLLFIRQHYTYLLDMFNNNIYLLPSLDNGIKI